MTLSADPALAPDPKRVAAPAPPPHHRAPEPPPARPGRARRALFWAVALAAGAGGIWYEFLRDTPAPHSGPSAVAAPARPANGEFQLSDTEVKSLRIGPVAIRDFRAERVAEGRIAVNDDRSTPVYAPSAGRVVQVGPRLGDLVNQGDLLFSIDTQDLVTAANNLLSAVDALNKSRATLVQAQRTEARKRDMYQGRAASLQDYEQAQTDARNAASDLRAAEAAVDSARDAVRVFGRTPQQIAELERTRRVDAVEPIYAPLSGTVTQRRVGPGQWLTGGGDPVFTIADLTSMWLVASVREMDAPMIHVGQQVQVVVGALPGRVFDARITSMAAGLDPATRRLSVRAEVKDPDHLLKPEMYATFRIDIGQPANAVAVPTSAVIFRGSDASVWQALPDNHFALRPIQLGMRDGDMLQVVRGLNPGDRIVTGGALFVDRAARVD